MTYRQLDYWTRLGYVKTTGAPSPGSGGRRAWPAEEIEIAGRMVKLRDEGYELRLAARIARADVVDRDRAMEAAGKAFAESLRVAVNG